MVGDSGAAGGSNSMGRSCGIGVLGLCWEVLSRVPSFFDKGPDQCHVNMAHGARLGSQAPLLL